MADGKQPPDEPVEHLETLPLSELATHLKVTPPSPDQRATEPALVIGETFGNYRLVRRRCACLAGPQP